MKSRNDYLMRFTPLEIKKKYHNLSQSFGKKRYFLNIKTNPNSDLSIPSLEKDSLTQRAGFTP